MRITRARNGQLFLVLGAILIGCDVTEPTERSFTIRIDSFSVPETVSGTDSIQCISWGTWGEAVASISRISN